MPERQVIFLSVDKFMLPNSILVDSTQYLLNSKYMKDAIVFIDEFDSTKEVLLRKIIDEGYRHPVDEINLFLDIRNGLHREYPAAMPHPS